MKKMLLFQTFTLSLVVLWPAPSRAWQDLSHEYVKKQVTCLVEPGKTSEQKNSCLYSLVRVGRSAIHPLGQVARKYPQLAWTAVHVLDTIRTNSEVVRLFSEFLDKPPPGLQSTGEVRGFLSSRLEQMLGREFKDGSSRRKWIEQHSKNLVYDPARFRFELDAQAYRGGWLPTKVKEGPQSKVALAYERLIKALHTRQEKVVRTLTGPEVKLVKAGRKEDTRPELDLDAFSDPIHNHRAITIRDEGDGRWLVRSGSAYFFFAGKDLSCVKAGMKPID